jgi:hypothetical protein
MSWAHLTPPKINIYVRAHACPSPFAFRLTGRALQIHFVCNPSTGACAAKLRALLFEVSLQAGRPPQRPVPPQVENPAEWPPMAACAGCEKEETATTVTRACAGCGVSRCVVLAYLCCCPLLTDGAPRTGIAGAQSSLPESLR